MSRHSLISEESYKELLRIKEHEGLTDSEVNAIEIFIAGLKARRNCA